MLKFPGHAESACRIFTEDENVCYSTGNDRARVELLSAAHRVCQALRAPIPAESALAMQPVRLLHTVWTL